VLASLLIAGCGAGDVPEATMKPSDTIATNPAGLAADTVDTDVPYVQTPPRIVERMLRVAEVTERDTVYDLGSGDGRIAIAAAREFGAHAVGVEIVPRLVDEARRNAREAGVADRVTFRQGDLFEADLSGATVVTLYLLPDVNRRLRPRLLRQLDPGDRVVSHDFHMGEWLPDRTIKTGDHTIYRWRVPREIPEDLQPAE
jgi:SAM-dependent methyltransferase